MCNHKITRFLNSAIFFRDEPLSFYEEQVLRLISPNGITKLVGEHLCMVYFYHREVRTI